MLRCRRGARPRVKVCQQHGKNAGQEYAVESSGAPDRSDRRAQAPHLSRLVRSAPLVAQGRAIHEELDDLRLLVDLQKLDKEKAVKALENVLTRLKSCSGQRICSSCALRSEIRRDPLDAGQCVLKKLLQSCTEKIKPGLAVRSAKQAIFGALAPTIRQVAAFTAVARTSGVLRNSIQRQCQN